MLVSLRFNSHFVTGTRASPQRAAYFHALSDDTVKVMMAHDEHAKAIHRNYKFFIAMRSDRFSLFGIYFVDWWGRVCISSYHYYKYHYDNRDIDLYYEWRHDYRLYSNKSVDVNGGEVSADTFISRAPIISREYGSARAPPRCIHCTEDDGADTNRQTRLERGRWAIFCE